MSLVGLINNERVVTQKLWGVEDILFHTPSLCAKRLVVRGGYHSSTHYHKNKSALLYVSRGVVSVGREYGFYLLKAGDTCFIPNGVRHQFAGFVDSEIIEVGNSHDAASHDEADTFRYADRGILSSKELEKYRNECASVFAKHDGLTYSEKRAGVYNEECSGGIFHAEFGYGEILIDSERYNLSGMRVVLERQGFWGWKDAGVYVRRGIVFVEAEGVRGVAKTGDVVRCPDEACFTSLTDAELFAFSAYQKPEFVTYGTCNVGRFRSLRSEFITDVKDFLMQP